MKFDLERIHQRAIEVARKGGDLTLDYFNNDIEVERKGDASPVTEADRRAEELMREEIRSRFPDHGILGEEFDRENSDSPIQWVLDPIDGTRSFIHGVPLYTTLVAVLIENEPMVGVIYAPATGELCEAAEGEGTRLNDKKCRVRPCSDLSEASFLSTDASTHIEYEFDEPFARLIAKTRIHRTWGDAYGHMLVATGRADIMFDPVLNIWDAAPLLPIMRGAGGIFCDVTGKETIQTGNGLSCSRELLPQVLEQFKSR
ncbi:MAG: histidinol-phosphatase [Balneolaceae bacterium]|nr:histidinol-phosphatase [Balneolaceae bacterium]